MQDVAVELVNDRDQPLFPDTPVVFLTNTAAHAAPRELDRSDPRAQLTYRRSISFVGCSRTCDVFVVTGAAAADEDSRTRSGRQMPTSTRDCTFTYLSGLATKEFEDRLSKLPAHSAVYHVLVSEDGDGNKFHPLEYVDRVSAAANAPTYSWVDSAMDHGIVGGSLYSQSDAIERVGQLALRVLHGESADSIPVAALDLNRNEVDWRQLRPLGHRRSPPPSRDASSVFEIQRSGIGTATTS